MSETDINAFDEWPDPVLSVDSTNVVVHANGAAIEAFGYSLKTLAGLKLEHLFPLIDEERREWLRALYRHDPQSSAFTSGVTVTCVHSNRSIFKAHATFETGEVGGQSRTWVMLIVPGYRAGKDTSTRSRDSQRILRMTEKKSQFRPKIMGSAGGAAPVRSRRNLESEFQRLAGELLRTLRYNIFGLMQIDMLGGTATMNQLALEHAEPIHGRNVGSVFPLAGTVAQEVLKTRESRLVLVSDEQSFRRKYPGSVPDNIPFEYMSSLGVPVFKGDEITGMLFAQSREIDAFDTAQLDLLSRKKFALFREAR